MDSDSWTTSTRRRFHQNSLSRSDVYDEVDGGEEESRPEFMCPFCAEDYDVVGLCCHIDEEHPVEVKNGEGNQRSKSSYSSTNQDFKDYLCPHLTQGLWKSRAMEKETHA